MNKIDSSGDLNIEFGEFKKFVLESIVYWKW